MGAGSVPPWTTTAAPQAAQAEAPRPARAQDRAQAAPGYDALVVALSPDRRWLATLSTDGAVKLWKTTWTKDGSRIEALAQEPAGVSVVWSLLFSTRSVRAVTASFLGQRQYWG